MFFKGNFELRAVMTNPTTDKTTNGPVLANIGYCDWVHSGTQYLAAATSGPMTSPQNLPHVAGDIGHDPPPHALPLRR